MSKNAIISVSDKSYLGSLTTFLYSKDYTIFSTGGTHAFLHDIYTKNNYDTSRLVLISNYIDFPEILGGRVKTLHPKIYGGILVNRDNSIHMEDLMRNNIMLFDLVVVNLYPFKNVIANADVTLERAIENIDIGGVSLIRAAAKNYKHTHLLIEPYDYLEFIRNYDNLPENYRKIGAIKGYQCTCQYDKIISHYLKNTIRNATVDTISLKYGLNPQQAPAKLEFSPTDNVSDTSNIKEITNAFKVLNGSLGYINVLDIIHGWLIVREIDDLIDFPTTVSMKHTSPAGLGVGNTITNETLGIFGMPESIKMDDLTDIAKAFIKSRNCDPLSSFGDFICCSRPIDAITARLIKRDICDGIVAPDYSPEAYNILASKKKGKFIIVQMDMNYYNKMIENGWNESKEIYGIRLNQPSNKFRLNIENLKEQYENDTELIERKKIDLIIANCVLKYSQSNNISMAYDGQIIGLGCGQQNRVGCVRLAGEKAMNWIMRHQKEVIDYYKSLSFTIKRQEKVNLVYDFIKNLSNRQLNLRNIAAHEEFLFDRPNCVENIADFTKYDITMGSDGFFPFPDNIKVANTYNVKYIIQPGGSLADTEVQNACDKFDIKMFNTGVRMFYH